MTPTPQRTNDDRFGFYLHVPFCVHLCHYCDFAKTANYSPALEESYRGQLVALVPQVRNQLHANNNSQPSSLFLGGGTPSVWAEEYGEWLPQLVAACQVDAEITLEANPDDLSPERLRLWRQLGINRLSLGVQSFQESGLKVLTRQHSGAAARAAIQLAQDDFGANLNVDLIYGWPGQTLADWRADLQLLIDLGVAHLSAYTLTYEGRTAMARAYRRGKILPQQDDHLADCYDLARAMLADAGYQQDEVSNWSLAADHEQTTCRHNWLYWQDGSYLAVGAGAHGYQAQPTGPGERYAFTRSEREFVRAGMATLRVEPNRQSSDWLAEYIGSALRTAPGLDLSRIEQKTGLIFEPARNPVVAEALEQGLLQVADKRLRLTPAEWFRELAWGAAILDSFPV